MALANVPHVQWTKPEMAFVALNVGSPVDADVATAIGWIESGGGWTNAYRPENENPLGGQDTSWIQINEVWVDKLIVAGIISTMNDLLDPIVAYLACQWIRKQPGTGWGPWNYGPNAYGPKMNPPRPARTADTIDLAGAQAACANPINPYWRMVDAGMDVHDLPVPPKGTYVSLLPPPPLALGNSNMNVTRLQMALKEVGFYPFVLVQYFGNNTVAGVKKQQERLTECNLYTGPIDGRYSLAVWQAWDGARRYGYMERGR